MIQIHRPELVLSEGANDLPSRKSGSAIWEALQKSPHKEVDLAVEGLRLAIRSFTL